MIQEFKKKYKQELKEKKNLINQIKKLEKKHKTLTLLFSAKDTDHNNAIVLKEVIEK